MRILIPAVACALSACGVLECVDKQVPRSSKPLAEDYRFELQIRGMEPLKYTVKCEEFYSASCSERGNFWTVREIGHSRSSQRSAFSIKDNAGKDFDLELPTCQELVYAKKKLNLNNFNAVFERGKHVVTVDNGTTTTTSLSTTYWYKDSDGHHHSFRHIRQKGTPEQIVTFDFRLFLNGVEISGG